MKKIRNCLLTSLALFACGVTASAQDAVSRETSRAVGPAVTISVTERGVRFAALGSFGKMRLEVFNADGASLYNSDFAAASVRDWVLDNKDGLLLPDGTYLCVITIRDLSGRLSTKQGSVVLQGGQPSLKLPDGESVEVVEPDKSLARVTNPPDNALTLIGHDGKNGQLVSTRGALTFRFGDFFGGKDKELMRLTPEGNLGLGVKSPQAKLDVAGTIRANGIEFANGTTQTTGLSGRVDAQGNIIPAASGTGTQNRVAKWTDNSGTLGDSVITESSGKVGIGTAGPGGKLEVVGAPTDQTIVASVAPTAAGQAGKFNLKSSYDTTSVVFDAARITVYGSTGQYGNSSNYVGFDTATGADAWSTKMAMTLAGNVGIGTAGPAGKLEVVGAPTDQTIVASVAPTAAGQAGKFSLKSSYDATSAVFDAARITVYGSTGGYGNSSNYVGFDTAIGGDLWSTKMAMTLAGNVGIGTTNPGAKLDVDGNLNITGNATISGNIAAKYQDIAEWTSARSQLSSGTVVSLDTLRSNSVMASNKAYDTRVAGVISAQPGVILGEGGPNRVLVATTGRVKVRVNANRYPIHIGDLLVTSNTPGVAMKSQPFRVHGQIMHRPGTIIGKALESLSSGEGTILVLLSLQ